MLGLEPLTRSDSQSTRQSAERSLTQTILGTSKTDVRKRFNEMVGVDIDTDALDRVIQALESSQTRRMLGGGAVVVLAGIFAIAWTLGLWG